MADRSVTVGLYANVTGYVAGVKAAQTATAGFVSTLEKSAAKQQALKSLGNAAGVMGLAFGAGVAIAVGAAAKFDQSMSKVQAATHESAANMDLLRDAAIDAGAKTQYSATEAAGAIEALAKAGLKTKDILGATGGLNGALSLAAAGGQEVADAAESMASALNQFNLQGSSASHVADLLAAGAGKASGEVSDLSMALNQTGLIANSTGLSIEETVGALAEFASKGLLGSDAGTSFKNMLQRMNPQTEKASELVEQYNISAFDQQGNFIGLAKYAQKLHDGLGGLTDQQRQSTMATIFGTDSVRAATILYEDGAKGVNKWTTAVNDQGYAADTAAIKMDNLAGDIEQLRGSLETALIKTGEGAQAPLRGLTQQLTGLINAYIGLPDAVKKGGLEVSTFLALLGGGAFVASRMVGGLVSMRTNMTALGLSTSELNKKFLAQRAGAFALGAGLKIVSDQLDQSHDAAKKLLDVSGDIAIGFAVGGPFGAAVGGAVGAFSAMAAGAYDATAAEQAFRAALAPVAATLDQQTGAITRHTAASVAQSQADAGVLDIATKLGVSTDLVTKSIMGNTEAQQQFYTALGFSSQAQADQFLAFAKSSDHMDANTQSLVTLLDAVQSGAVDFDALGRHIDQTFQATLNSKKAFYGSTAAVESTIGAVDGATTAVDRHAEALGYDTEQLHKWVKAQNEAADAALQSRHDHYALVAAVDAATKSIAGITGGLNAHTKAGQRNEALIESLVSQWNDSTAGAQKAAGAYEKTRDTLIKMFMAMGKSQAEAKRLSADLLDVPDVVRVARLETQQASAAAHDLGIKLSDIKAPDLKAKMDIIDAMAAGRKLTDTLGNLLGGIRDEPVKVTLSAQADKVMNQLGHFGLASGGRVFGPGTGTSDSIPAMLSTGEHVWTADEVKKAGGHEVVMGLRRLAKLGELPKRGDISMFAGGGPVVQPKVSLAGERAAISTVDAMFDAITASLSHALSKQMNKLLTQMSWGSGTPLGMATSLTPAGVARGQQFAQSQAGKPYVWTGVGPGGYDCSGFQSAVLNAAHNAYPYRRLGSTATMPWAGSAPGVGMYSIGWSTNVGGSGIGHTSGNIGGLGVESNGSDGVVVGSGALSPTSSMFNGMMHYDKGGILPPGLTLALNGTGANEHVFTFAKGGAVHQAGVQVGHGIGTAITQGHGGDEMTAEQLAHAIAMAWKHFGFGPNATADKVKSELHDLISALREALGKDAPVLDRLKKLGDNLIKAAKAQDRVSAHLDALRDRMDAYAKSVAGTFRNDPFGGGVEGLMTQLQADRNDARKMHQALRKAKHKGLDGGLFQALAASGDLDTAQQLASMTPAEIHKYEMLWKQRQKATSTLGQFAGHSVFGQQIKRTANELHHLNKRLHQLEQAINHIGHHVQQGAHKGTRDGAREGAREQGRRAAHGIR